MRVAFLGLGTMGAPMAANVLRAGHRLTVWNRSPERAAPLAAAGASVAASPAECVDGAEAVLSMLADPAAVDVVYDAAAARLAPGALVVDLSTVDPATARRTAARVTARGARFVDAPVSGSRQPAIDGKLLILAGGSEADVAAVTPLLSAMGAVLRVGGVGQGMAMKLVLNGLGAHMMTGFCAMLAFGARQGLPLATMLEVIGRGAFSSPLYASKGARIAARDFRPDFTVRLMRKDQQLVQAALARPLPTLDAIVELLDDAVAHGHGDDDLSGLIQELERP